MNQSLSDQTNEFSFILQVSSIPGAGIGVFITHAIEKDVRLMIAPKNARSRRRKASQIPDCFKPYCIIEDDEWCRGPLRFNRMEIGWYINHSFTPNIEKRVDGLYSLRNIVVGEEIVMDYNDLNEPEHKKEAYYIKDL